jgi:chromodomain-helicase-DNA-binding protein 7
VSIRKKIRQLLIFGVGDCPYRKALLHFAATESSLSEDESEILAKLLGLKSLEEPTKEIRGSLSEFASNLNDVRDRKASIVRRAILFWKIGAVLSALQKPLGKWPFSDKKDPVDTYKLLLDVFRNGIREGLLLNDQRNMSLKKVEKKVFERVDTLYSFVDVSPDLADNGELMSAEDWQKAQSHLYNRCELNDDELQTLLVTINGLGLPKRKDSAEIDWQKIMGYTHINCVSLEAVTRSGDEIIAFSDDEGSLCERLGSYGTKIWQRRLKNSIRDIGRIRSFVECMDKADEEHITQIKHFDAAEWWTAEHDIALLRAINEFGQLFVATWIVDSEGPFRSHIPSQLLGDFEKCAATELTKGRQCKPKETCELSFLFKDKVRMARALFVVKYIETRRCRRKVLPKRVICPQVPFTLNSHLVVTNWGAFASSRQLYPIGYTCHTCFVSAVRPTEQIWYEASVLSESLFRMRMMCEPFHSFMGGSCDSAVSQVMECASPGLGSTVNGTGEHVFGFGVPLVREVVKNMRDACRDLGVPGKVEEEVVMKISERFDLGSVMNGETVVRVDTHHVPLIRRFLSQA